jgi:tetratricopeptide (TPR) repeat protein
VKKYFLYLTLVGITFLVYSNVINGEFLFDDEHFVVRNPYIKNFSYIKDIFLTSVTSGIGFKDNFYRPLSIFLWIFVYKIFGLNPIGFHLTNILTHIFCGIFIYLILLHLFNNRLASFCGSMFFLIHPIQTEAVSYISGFGDLISFLFLLIAIYSYIKIVKNISLTKKKSFLYLTFYYLIFCISTILAMLGKERAVMMVLLLPLVEISFKDRLFLPQILSTKQSKKKFNLYNFNYLKLKKILLLSFPVLSAIFWFYLRSVALKTSNTFNFYRVENIYSSNILVRIYTFFYALVVYLKLLIIPYPLHMERTIPVFTSIFYPEVLLGFCVLILGFIFAIKSFYKKKIFFFTYFWFLISLAPTSGIFPINALIMEHWLYFSLFGISVLIAFIVYEYKNVKFIFFLCFIIWSIMTFYQNRVWKNAYVFFQHILKYNPNSIAANNNFAMCLADNGELDKAIFYYKKAISLDDTFPQPHHNLARVYISKNDLKNALIEYYRALEIDPNFVFSHQDLATIFDQLGDKQRAQYHKKRVSEILKN